MGVHCRSYVTAYLMVGWGRQGGGIKNSYRVTFKTSEFLTLEMLYYFIHNLVCILGVIKPGKQPKASLVTSPFNGSQKNSVQSPPFLPIQP